MRASDFSVESGELKAPLLESIGQVKLYAGLVGVLARGIKVAAREGSCSHHHRTRHVVSGHTGYGLFSVLSENAVHVGDHDEEVVHESRDHHLRKLVDMKMTARGSSPYL